MASLSNQRKGWRGSAPKKSAVVAAGQLRRRRWVATIAFLLAVAGAVGIVAFFLLSRTINTAVVLMSSTETGGTSDQEFAFSTPPLRYTKETWDAFGKSTTFRTITDISRAFNESEDELFQQLRATTQTLKPGDALIVWICARGVSLDGEPVLLKQRFQAPKSEAMIAPFDKDQERKAVLPVERLIDELKDWNGPKLVILDWGQELSDPRLGYARNTFFPLLEQKVRETSAQHPIWFLTSHIPGEVSNVDARNRQRIFGRAVAEVLNGDFRMPDDPMMTDKLIGTKYRTLQHIADYVYRRVQSDTGNAQTPWLLKTQTGAVTTDGGRWQGAENVLVQRTLRTGEPVGREIAKPKTKSATKDGKEEQSEPDSPPAIPKDSDKTLAIWQQWENWNKQDAKRFGWSLAAFAPDAATRCVTEILNADLRAFAGKPYDSQSITITDESKKEVEDYARKAFEKVHRSLSEIVSAQTAPSKAQRNPYEIQIEALREYRSLAIRLNPLAKLIDQIKQLKQLKLRSESFEAPDEPITKLSEAFEISVELCDQFLEQLDSKSLKSDESGSFSSKLQKARQTQEEILEAIVRNVCAAPNVDDTTKDKDAASNETDASNASEKNAENKRKTKKSNVLPQNRPLIGLLLDSPLLTFDQRKRLRDAEYSIERDMNWPSELRQALPEGAATEVSVAGTAFYRLMKTAEPRRALIDDSNESAKQPRRRNARELFQLTLPAAKIEFERQLLVLDGRDLPPFKLEAYASLQLPKPPEAPQGDVGWIAKWKRSEKDTAKPLMLKTDGTSVLVELELSYIGPSPDKPTVELESSETVQIKLKDDQHPLLSLVPDKPILVPPNDLEESQSRKEYRLRIRLQPPKDKLGDTGKQFVIRAKIKNRPEAKLNCFIPSKDPVSLVVFQSVLNNGKIDSVPVDSIPQSSVIRLRPFPGINRQSDFTFSVKNGDNEAHSAKLKLYKLPLIASLPRGRLTNDKNLLISEVASLENSALTLIAESKARTLEPNTASKLELGPPGSEQNAAPKSATASPAAPSPASPSKSAATDISGGMLAEVSVDDGDGSPARTKRYWIEIHPHIPTDYIKFDAELLVSLQEMTVALDLQKDADSQAPIDISPKQPLRLQWDAAWWRNATKNPDPLLLELDSKDSATIKRKSNLGTWRPPMDAYFNLDGNPRAIVLQLRRNEGPIKSSRDARTDINHVLMDGVKYVPYLPQADKEKQLVRDKLASFRPDKSKLLSVSLMFDCKRTSDDAALERLTQFKVKLGEDRKEEIFYGDRKLEATIHFPGGETASVDCKLSDWIFEVDLNGADDFDIETLTCQVDDNSPIRLADIAIDTKGPKPLEFKVEPSKIVEGHEKLSVAIVAEDRTDVVGGSIKVHEVGGTEKAESFPITVDFVETPPRSGRYRVEMPLKTKTLKAGEYELTLALKDSLGNESLPDRGSKMKKLLKIEEAPPSNNPGPGASSPKNSPTGTVRVKATRPNFRTVRFTIKPLGKQGSSEDGEFAFADIPFGDYTIEASTEYQSGTWTGSSQISLKSLDDYKATVQVVLRP